MRRRQCPSAAKLFKRHRTSWLWAGLWLWLIAACAAAIPCRAQNVVLVLRNGDRLSGCITSETADTVVLSTPFASGIEVPKSMIELRQEVPSPAVVTPVPLVPATGIASELAGTNKPVKITAGTRSEFRKFLSEWHGEAQLGANLGYSTVNRESFTGHAKFVELHPFADTNTAMRNTLEYNVTYGKTDNQLSDNRMEGRIKNEYDFTKRFYVFNESTAGYDEIQGIRFQYDVGPGVGYRWVVLTNFVFKTETGADYQEQFFTNAPATSRYAARVEEDLWWQVTPKFKFDEKVEFFPELNDPHKYRTRIESNLSYLLRQNLTLSFNVIDVYDTGLPTAVSRNDLQIRSLLGLKF
jgi:putative salt-induced outer membrane protein YdiY